MFGVTGKMMMAAGARVPVGDPYFNQVVLLMHMDVAGYPDVKGKTVTTGGTPSLDTTTKQFGAASAALSTGVLNLASSADFNLSGDYTVEGWFYPTAFGTNRVLLSIGNTSGDQMLLATIVGSGNQLWYLLNGTAIIQGSFAPNLNAWNYFALVKSGVTTSMYLNGVLNGSNTANATPANTNKTVQIGTDGYSGTAHYSGNVDEIRITKGVGRPSLTVPTAAFKDF